MNSNEILNKYINLIDKGYCSDCNELNCIDNFPHSKITHAIRELQQENQSLKKENKILRENAEHNDKVVDKVNWENMLLKKENEQLQERIEYLERSNNRREDTILEQRQEISDLEDNWNKLKEYISSEWYCFDNESVEFEVAKSILDKMQELKQGED